MYIYIYSSVLSHITHETTSHLFAQKPGNFQHPQVVGMNHGTSEQNVDICDGANYPPKKNQIMMINHDNRCSMVGFSVHPICFPQGHKTWNG